MQSFKQTYLMLFASPYSIENKDGTKNEGVSAWFIFDDNLTARIDEEAAARGQEVHGIKPVKANLPYSVAQKVKSCPGYYDVTLKLVTKRVEVRGQATEVPTMQILDINFAGSIDAKLKEHNKPA